MRGSPLNLADGGWNKAVAAANARFDTDGPAVVDRGDPIERLPDEARAKVNRFRALKEDVLAAIQSLVEREGEWRNVWHGAKQALVAFERAAPFVTVTTDDDIKRLEYQREARQAAVDHAKAELDAIIDRRQRAMDRIPKLIDRTENWLRGLPGNVKVHSTPKRATLQKNETPQIAIEKARARLTQLRAQLHETRSAPLTSNAAKAIIREWIDSQAERARPDVLPTIELGHLPHIALRLPHRPLHPAIMLTERNFFGPPPERIGAEMPDTLAFLCWLERDKIVARLEAEVDELADDSQALDPEEKAKREAAILAAIFDEESVEERFIEMAEANGTPVQRRDDADIRAVLQLDASAPGGAA